MFISNLNHNATSKCHCVSKMAIPKERHSIMIMKAVKKTQTQHCRGVYTLIYALTDEGEPMTHWISSVDTCTRHLWLWNDSRPSRAWASCQIRKIAGCACAGNAGNVFPTHRLQRKPLVSDPDMHHGTCVTHVPWCMSGSLTCGGGENVPGIPSACAPAIWRIWQEAHWCDITST